MRQGLPEQVAPFELAAAGGTLQAVIGIAQLPRLGGLIFDPEGKSAGQITVELYFSPGEHGGCVLSGHLAGVLTLQCQRCMGSMPWPIDLDISLHLVASEGGAEWLPQEADVLVVADDRLQPRELVEDEIILALPLVPRHPDSAECDPAGKKPPVPEPEERTNPFSVLRNLKI